MSRINCYMPSGYYCSKMKKENDKYYGLFSKKQMSDLEGGARMEVTHISKKDLKKKIREQKKQGAGDTFMRPVDFGDYEE